MVMIMVMLLLLITILPKMVQDPETMEEMQVKMNVQSQIPDMPEMITSLWGGGPTQTQNKNVPVRRQQR